ncbi:MAG: glutamate-5-semialdehyde dehydrogenase [bacterium]
MTQDIILEEISRKALQAKLASRKLALISDDVKKKALIAMAESIEKNRKEIIFRNEIDLEAAKETNLSAAIIDRLRFDDKRINSLIQSLNEVGELKDPVGEIIESKKNKLGFYQEKIRVPLGVIGIIYESRPNVTVDATALCLKAGNSVILKGGREAADTNRQLYHVIAQAAYQAGIPEGSIQFIETSDRRAIEELIKLDHLVDLIIARGGEEMIRSVREKSIVPVLGHGKGLCHTYIDEDADVSMAENIAFNAKVQRPGVCNAMESLLIHENIAPKITASLMDKFKKAGVRIKGCERTKAFAPWIEIATEEDYRTEYLDMILSVKIVSSFDEAINHINRFGSGHSEAIVTQNKNTADRFLKTIDAACVFHNASTRLHDGGIFGLGAEIGISTQKLHARGTMGVRELTTTKYIIKGSGQIRE